jgi:hypothetical protein
MLASWRNQMGLPEFETNRHSTDKDDRVRMAALRLFSTLPRSSGQINSIQLLGFASSSSGRHPM